MTHQQDAEDRWHRRLDEVGLTYERSTQEWLDHPTALDDLMRVMGGTHLMKINWERRKAARIPQQRRAV